MKSVLISKLWLQVVTFFWELFHLLPLVLPHVGLLARDYTFDLITAVMLLIAYLATIGLLIILTSALIKSV